MTSRRPKEPVFLRPRPARVSHRPEAPQDIPTSEAPPPYVSPGVETAMPRVAVIQSDAPSSEDEEADVANAGEWYDVDNGTLEPGLN